MGSQKRKNRDAAISRHEKKPQKTSIGSLFPSHFTRKGTAPAHKTLKNELVHVFVDDQNLFWGIVNQGAGINFRIDFGQLLSEVTKDSQGNSRAVKSAYIAGVIPDDDSFWQVAENQGFTVKRGYLGAGGRSKQDDAFLITDIMSTLYEEEGPSTIILVAGDADYMPPLIKTQEKGWRNEAAFITCGISQALDPYVHEFRAIDPQSIELLKFRKTKK